MKTINVLMIYPKLPPTFWNIEYGMNRFLREKISISPPLGLLTVAALMPDNYAVTLIDLNVDQLREEDLLHADIVFLSAMILHRDSFHQVVGWCNQLGVPVAAGGPYPTKSHAEIEGVDYFVLNEAEITLPAFLRDYEAGRPKHLYRSGSRPDMTGSPVPRYDLIKPERYYMMPAQFSRGCPHNCEFCDIIELFGRKPRTKTVKQFIREMDAIYNTGFRGEFLIVDDNFIGNKTAARRLLREIARWQEERDTPFELLTQVGLDLAQDDELMDLMVSANFCRVMIGIETPDTGTLLFTQKRHNTGADHRESVRRIMGRGIMVMASFIIGFDTDPENIFDLQIEFIQKAGIAVAGVGLLVAFPGTQLSRRLKKENRLREDVILTGNNIDLSLNFIPKIPEERLIAGYKKVIMDIYNPKKYFERCYSLLRQYPDGYKNKIHLRKGYLIPFFKCILLMTFSRYGHHYLRFFLRIARLNPELLRNASLLSAMGYHFFKNTRDVISFDYFKRHKAQASLGPLRMN